MWDVDTYAFKCDSVSKFLSHLIEIDPGHFLIELVLVGMQWKVERCN